MYSCFLVSSFTSSVLIFATNPFFTDLVFLSTAILVLFLATILVYRESRFHFHYQPGLFVRS